MNFILSAEAACDLSGEAAKKYSVSVMPMKYYIDGVEYDTSKTEFTMSDLYKRMESGALTSTTQPNEFEIREYLTGLLKHGKDVLHLSFSSAMSGTCASFKKIAEELNENSVNKITVVDTLCQSSGVALLIATVCEKAEKENLSVKEAAEYIESIKLSVVHYFAVDTLTYLARGGRVAPSLAIFGNLINIKPVLNVDDSGKIVMIQKVIGKKHALKCLLEKFRKHYVPISKTVFISEANSLSQAEYVKEELLKIAPDLNVIINPLGPVIACHSGPGTVALYFTAEGRIK